MPKALLPNSQKGAKLPQEFYGRRTEAVAKALLGKRLVRVFRGKRLSGLIVETEAYLGAKDPACHTWKNRRTERVSSMYLPGGNSYVYMIYGMHHCFNVVTRREDEPEAVLIRALAPEAPESPESPEEESAPDRRMDGPGRLCKALRIGRSLDGLPLTGETIFIEETGRAPRREEVGKGPRIGVDYAGEAAGWPLRFYWRGNPHLSRKERGWKNLFPPTKPSGPTT
jgi:DNA-3-methyladenine glycosylase